MKINLRKAIPDDCPEIIEMVVELLEEISERSGHPFEGFEESTALSLLQDGISSGKCWTYVAIENDQLVGFINICESFAIYAGGKFGTITELYIRKSHRSQQIGKFLLDQAASLARAKNWCRFEVTTPPLPEFARSLVFYQRNGFAITGGRKLKRFVGQKSRQHTSR